jgi:hypothetical protein
MNTYYLKRIRRRYKYYWDTHPEWDDTMWVLNLEKQEVAPFKNISQFLQGYVSDEIGFCSSIRYARRLLRRHKRKQFHEHLRNFSLNSLPSPNTTP